MIKKMWYIYLVEYHSAMKKEILLFLATWLYLEVIRLSEIRQRQILYGSTYMWSMWNLKIHKQTNNSSKIFKEKQRIEWWFPESGKRENEVMGVKA